MADNRTFDPRIRMGQKAEHRRDVAHALASGRPAGELERSNGLSNAASSPDGMISRQEARALLSHLSEDRGVCLVGGQAVGLWAYFLDPDGERLGRYMPYATSDIDYLGDLAAARRFAERSGGTLFRPGADVMNSNSTALVELDASGRRVVVDFLHSIIGVQTDEVRRRAIATDFCGVSVVVLHPLHVVRSRIGNMLSAATSRRDLVSTNQALAAVDILELWCADRLAAGDGKAVTGTLSNLIAYSDRDFFGRRALIELDIDLLKPARNLLMDERLPALWREKSLAPALARTDDRSTSRRQRIAPNPLR